MARRFTEGDLTTAPRHSIKRSIGIWYIFLYLLITLLTFLTVSFSYAYNVNKKIDNETEKISVITQALLESNNFKNSLYIQENLEAMNEYYNTENMALLSDGEGYYVAKNDEVINKYVNSLMNNSNTKYKNINKTALLSKNYIVNVSVIEVAGKEYYLLSFFLLTPYINEMLVIMQPMALVLSLGILILYVVGYMKVERVLAPINKMTQTTKLITTENLDLRLDVKGSTYELKELAKTTNEMIDSFQASYERQERFVSDVSHELRTPISVILGYANMLKRWGADDKEVLEESVDSIINETNNMSDLVKRLLFLAKYDKNTLSYDFKIMNLSDTVTSLARDASMMDSGANIHYDIDEDIYIKGDNLRIVEATRIFIDNAIKYSKDSDPGVYISLHRDADNAYLAVRDNGVGISKNDLVNVFNRFYRADESRTKETGGLGLGLSIAKAIVLDHKGEITVKTKEGEGSEFTLVFPLADESEVEIEYIESDGDE